MNNTRYSEEIPGSRGNYDWGVRFDRHNGYLGINQWNDEGLERILLSPKQVKALLEFIGAEKARAPTACYCCRDECTYDGCLCELHAGRAVEDE
jgi:hypothetical protein